MRSILLAGFVFVGAVVQAPVQAQEAVKTGASPAWVVPVDAPPPPADEGGIALRLVDLQTRIDENGSHMFAHQIVKMSSPEALQQAGSVAVVWQPTFGSAIVHSVIVRRAGRKIDVLDGGKGFTVLRRETGLDSGQIDGVLTAVMQVPGLQVGDEVEYSFTVDRKNPVLGGHNEMATPLLGGIVVDRLYVRDSWPSALPVGWRFGDALPKPVKTVAGGTTSVVVDKAAFKLPTLPDRTPGRFLDTAMVQLGDFAGWQTVGAVMEPLYGAASKLGAASKVQDEITRIAAAGTDQKARALAALKLVQSQVRYFANAEGLGGYSPATADQVWALRSGDCKGKTVLLLAMLHGLGVDAVPVLVSSQRGDGVDTALPMPGRFDHVIVRAVIGGKTYWLDGTRLGDNDLDRIAVPPFKWGLPLVPGTTGLVALQATMPALPETDWRLDLDARAGLTAPAKVTGEGVYRGDVAMSLRARMALLSGTQRDELLRNIWLARHDWVKIDTVSYTADDANGVVRIAFTGTGTMDWNRSGPDAANHYEANKSQMGRNLTPNRKDYPLPGAYPVTVDPSYDVVRQTILLPDGGKDYYLQGDQIDQTIGGIRYRRTATLANGRFEMVATTQNSPSEIGYSQAQAADTASDALFAKRLYIHLPDGAKSLPVVVSMSEVPAANPSADPADIAKALARNDASLAKGPHTAALLAERGALLAKLRRTTDAAAAYDEALALDRNNPEALAAKADMLVEQDRAEDALILLDRLVLLQGDTSGPYWRRANARAMTRQYQGAADDLAIYIAKKPDVAEARTWRANLFLAMQQPDHALAEADALIAKLPNNASGHALRGAILAKMKRNADAQSALARSISIEPTAEAYVTRLQYGLSGDVKHQLDDVLATIRLQPDRTIPRMAVAGLAGYPAARPTVHAAYDAAATADTDRAENIGWARAYFDANMGDMAPLLKAVDAAVEKDAKDSNPLNTACWVRGTYNVELDKALAQCTQAIGMKRQAAYLDSRGLIQLQKHDYAKAIEDYDAALALRPAEDGSRYARGVSRIRAGDAKGGKADIDAALKNDPDLARQYAEYGVKP